MTLITDEPAHGLDSAVDQIRDRALALGALDRLERQLAGVGEAIAALRALLGPEAPDGSPAPPVVGAALIGMLSRDPDRVPLKVAAAEAGVDKTTVARWAESDPSLGTKSRGRWWISRTELQKHIEARKTS